MPGYGLAPTDGGQGLLPWSWAEERLRAARRYWVATAGAAGPHLAAVWALWADDQLYFSTGGASRKARDLAADPRVSVSLEGAAESLVLTGVAERVTDLERLASIQSAYEAKHGMGYPDPDENPVFAIRVCTAIAVTDDELAFTELATRWTFTDDERKIEP
ncbi:MAG: pyridoxamine 5'-phosphate oxidase family protein [Acidimicrobiales bacterium]